MHKAELSKAEVALWGWVLFSSFFVEHKSLTTITRIEHITKWKKLKSRVTHQGKRNVQHAIQDVEAAVHHSQTSNKHEGDVPEKKTPDNEGSTTREATADLTSKQEIVGEREKHQTERSDA
jgi:hypothetical protein